MLSSHSGAPCAPGIPLINLDKQREDVRDAIVRAWRSVDRARTDAEFEDVDANLTRLCNQLADLRAHPVGRVPSEV